MSTEADTTQNTPTESTADAPVTEVIEVQGNKLIETVKDIFAAGKVHRLTISSIDGGTLLDIPYVAGLSVAVLIALFIPTLALLTPIGLLLGRFTIEVVRPAAEQA